MNHGPIKVKSTRMKSIRKRRDWKTQIITGRSTVRNGATGMAFILASEALVWSDRSRLHLRLDALVLGFGVSYVRPAAQTAQCLRQQTEHCRSRVLLWKGLLRASWVHQSHLNSKGGCD